MAGITPRGGSTSSRAPSETPKEQMVGANFIRMEQIGSGSFANVYRGKHVRVFHFKP